MPMQRFIQAFFYGRWTALETQSLIQFLNSIFEAPNYNTRSTLKPNLNPNPKQ